MEDQTNTVQTANIQETSNTSPKKSSSGRKWLIGCSVGCGGCLVILIFFSVVVALLPSPEVSEEQESVNQTESVDAVEEKIDDEQEVQDESAPEDEKEIEPVEEAEPTPEVEYEVKYDADDFNIGNVEELLEKYPEAELWENDAPVMSDFVISVEGIDLNAQYLSNARETTWVSIWYLDKSCSDESDISWDELKWAIKTSGVEFDGNADWEFQQNALVNRWYVEDYKGWGHIYSGCKDGETYASFTAYGWDDDL